MSRRLLLTRSLLRGAWLGGGLSAVALSSLWALVALGGVAGPVHEVPAALLPVPVAAAVPLGAALGAAARVGAALVLLTWSRGHLRVHPARVVLAALLARDARRRPAR
ncbi:hypothetical protein [Kineococcus gypseus]|uniref:hypothetical protein n=1 Tax=Kineococcus gypseus TaxID=1637102 RepID=UPI003D7DA093